MPKKRRRSAAKAHHARRGLAPGSGDYVGAPQGHSVRYRVLEYDPDGVRDHTEVRLDALRALADAPTVAWVQVQGVHDGPTVRGIAKAFDLHPLVVEDILNPTSRAKVEDYGGWAFVVCRALPDAAAPDEERHVALVLGPAWVLSFQEGEEDLFEGVRARILAGTGRIRRMGAAYLAHALLDSVVDGYFGVVEGLETRIAALEEGVLEGTERDPPRAVHGLRLEVGAVRRLVWPMRDIVAGLPRLDGLLIGEATLPFYRDLADHIHQVVEQLDAGRERITSALELDLALASNRMNDVMRVLTIVSTLFIPLGFIVGLYGMNFAHMPELSWRWGYPAVWGLMLTLVVVMLVIFRRKRWL